jgi:hypothetical protein
MNVTQPGGTLNQLMSAKQYPIGNSAWSMLMKNVEDLLKTSMGEIERLLGGPESFRQTLHDLPRALG